ncbi:hypothetical protein HanXRQr2_Chr13g0614491 [Helianthus annuus]|uniref:Uncharacterized protein n=1 Tax=Helianthus annuus TaxID=4232 RepID=A0A9K3EP95_HELAN|nr:hypothetical protein HanXRQr2_Chr13g0614491 [Helianthus annuus]
MSNEQYSLFLKLFGGNKAQEESAPQANMAGIENEELDWSR